ncbi:MAG: hypothetical protein ABI648_09005 [Betaproteobacteria bacterium]
MSHENKPVGELFARVYLERGAPTQDNDFFRNRLEAYLSSNHYKDYAELSKYLKQEAGLVVPVTYQQQFGLYYNFPDFLSKTRIEYLLTAMTLIWRFLRQKYPQATRASKPGIQFETIYPQADAWHAFVTRTLREENMAYALDEKCGVHFFVDEEFERNRVSALRSLEAPRYAGVRAAFEAAHGYLDAQPPDTKASVRSMFEALEILARLIDPQSKNLNKWSTENKLKELALSGVTDATERDSIAKTFDGLAQWVDGLHNYRHGQGVPRPVAPSLTFAVYVISSGAATLRWLADLDTRDEEAKTG